MRPIRTQSGHKLTKQEGRFLLATKALKIDGIATLREAAKHFDVLYTTLKRCFNGDASRLIARANTHKLT